MIVHKQIVEDFSLAFISDVITDGACALLSDVTVKELHYGSHASALA